MKGVREVRKYTNSIPVFRTMQQLFSPRKFTQYVRSPHKLNHEKSDVGRGPEGNKSIYQKGPLVATETLISLRTGFVAVPP